MVAVEAFAVAIVMLDYAVLIALSAVGTLVIVHAVNRQANHHTTAQNTQNLIDTTVP